MTRNDKPEWDISDHLSPNEMRALTRNAKAAGMSVADFVVDTLIKNGIISGPRLFNAAFQSDLSPTGNTGDVKQRD
jgi:hypothetical protein